MRKYVAVVATVMALMGTAACGDNESVEPKVEAVETEAVETPVVYDESQVRGHLGLTEDGYITTPEGVECEAIVVMTSKGQVDMYAEAGDIVATNPDGTAGVKVAGDERATCRDFFTEGLSTFPDGAPVESEEPAAEEAPVAEEVTAQSVAATLGCELEGEPQKNAESEYNCGRDWFIVDWSTSGLKPMAILDHAWNWVGIVGEDFFFASDYIVVYGSYADIAEYGPLFQ